MNKYRLLYDSPNKVEEEINILADQGYVITAFAADSSEVGSFTQALMRLRSEETEPDPADGWCLGKDKTGKRCLLDSVRDGLCKKHWREAAAQGLLGSA